MTRVYEELIEFIAGGPTRQAVAEWTPSDAARERVAELVRREKAEGLSAEERSELDQYMELEHVMRMAKARARACGGHE